MKKLYLILKICIFIVILLLAIHFTSKLLEDKSSIKKYKDFYEDDTELDILFSGSSHMMDTILPMELYKKYGITSYNIANNTEAIPTSYWVIRNAVKQRKPKIIVLEVFYDGWDKKVRDEDKNYLHKFFDTAPLNMEKIMALKDLVGVKNMGEYLFNLSYYNSRWKELTEEDFNVTYSTEKGAESLIKYQFFDYKYDDKYEHTNLPMFNTSKKYLNKLIKYCEENDIKLILFQAPFPADESALKMSSKYIDLTEENNIPFYNLLKSSEIDYTTYMADGGHLNIYGAKKVTNMLGEYLIKNYGDILESKNIKRWNTDLEKYNDFNKKRLNDAKKIDDIILLADSLDYRVEFSLGTDVNISNFTILKSFFEKKIINLNENEKCDKLLCVSLYKDGELIMKYNNFNKDGSLKK